MISRKQLRWMLPYDAIISNVQDCGSYIRYNFSRPDLMYMRFVELPEEYYEADRVSWWRYSIMVKNAEVKR